MSTYIYALVDEYGTPRYVGQTTKRLSLRLAQHVSAAKRGKRPLDAWLRSCPGATIIPLESSEADADTVERKWIAQMRAGLVPLLNILDGGRREATGLRHSSETRQRLSRARKGRPLTPEHRAKLSESHTGVPLSDAHRDAIGRGGRGLTRSPETRARMSASKSGDLNPMSRTQRIARESQGGDAL